MSGKKEQNFQNFMIGKYHLGHHGHVMVVGMNVCMLNGHHDD